MPQEWVEQLYSFAFQPDITFYFSLPLRTALDRILVGRPALKYHEAGMDLGLSPDPVESFKIFQGKIHKEYEALARKNRFDPDRFRPPRGGDPGGGPGDPSRPDRPRAIQGGGPEGWRL